MCQKKKNLGVLSPDVENKHRHYVLVRERILILKGRVTEGVCRGFRA